MDRPKHRKSNSPTVIFLILLAMLFFVTAGALLLRQSRSDSAPVSSLGDVEHVDPAARDMPLGIGNRIFGIRLNDPTTFSYSVAGKVKVDSATGEARLRATNPPENTQLMAVEITLAGEDYVLYRSGYMKPNQRIETAKLEEIPEPGTYDAVVYFCAIDHETEELLGILEQPVKLEVK